MTFNQAAIKAKLQKYRFDLPVILLFGFFISLSYLVDFSTGEQLFQTTFWRFFSEMIAILP